MGYVITILVSLAIGYGAGRYEDLWLPQAKALWTKIVAWDKSKR
jgi:hypothetical protein